MPELGAIARSAIAAGPAGAAAVGQIVKHVSDKYLAGNESARSAPVGPWADLVGALSKGLAPEIAKAWEARLWGAYVADVAGLGTLSRADCGTLEGVLGQLGSTRSPLVTVEWVTRTEAAKGLDAGSLTELAGKLTALGPPAQAALTKLAGFAQRRYLDDPGAARAIGLEGLSGLVGAFGKLPAPVGWARKIHSAYVDDAGALAGLKAEDCGRLEELLKQAGMAAPNVLMAWVENTEAWKQGDLAALTGLAAKLGESAQAGELGKKAQARVLSHVEAEYLGDVETTRAIGCAGWAQAVEAVGKSLGEKPRLRWASRLRAAYVEAPGALAALKPADAQALSRTLESLGGGQGKALLGQWLAQKNSK
ncbi:MAG: hypothetical protein NTV86_08195 [Planctomycetota bacterium]|nr:hypothetical protein [Planctomycetota bacterium]